jgi:phosphate acyltransferase
VTTIAVDVMSGDRPPAERASGALRALEADRELRALLVGARDALDAIMRRATPQVRARIEPVTATQVVGMGESPREAIRRKKASSMRIAIDLVHEGRAGACVSAGNTGALTAMAHFVLKTPAGVERAAIMTAIPAARGHTHMLDLGANARASATQLRQFAVMGAIVARDVYAIPNPRIGLLNIGAEEIKGPDIVQEAHALLAGMPGYVGFVEGDDIFSGDLDVVVTDGFTGNVALKTMEGLADLIVFRMRREFSAGLAARLAGWVARPVLKRVAMQLDTRQYNGACMVGLGGIVVKSHGRADEVAFARAITLAAHAARCGLSSHVAQAFEPRGN